MLILTPRYVLTTVWFDIWKLKFGHKAFFLFTLYAQGLVKILKFGDILKLMLDGDSKDEIRSKYVLNLVM